ncbi:retrovirus-related Pol polyprotein from transposon opus [Trichonephila clavipes]|nr:retrovirus-related Pol polyprotein from transposon opus [Trichonephila clavipes]
MECVCIRSRTQDVWCQQRMFLQAAPSILRGVLPEIKGQVDKLLQAGLIKESKSPYLAPVTLTFRRDEGKKTRLYIDFRKLNALCKADSEPLLIMDSLLDKLARAKFFSTLDLASGYWHVPIHPKDTEKLAFCANFGLYKWCRLPFEIKVAPAIFNRLIRRILTKFKKFLRNYNIKHLLTTAHPPQTNGKNERVNQSLVTRLKCKVNASSTKIPWTKLLDQVCNEYNSTPHSITKYPSAYLLFGLLPYQSPIDQNNYYEPDDEARGMASQRTVDYHIKNKSRYDARCIEKKFNPGDLVVYEEFQYPNTRKLSSLFSGPYEIIKQCSEVTYGINKPNSLAKKDSQIVHISKLRCFYSPDNLKLSHE